MSVLVAQHLRSAILSGKLPIGYQLPSEKTLTQAMGVSRATLREALRILQGQGLITGGSTVSTHRPRVTNELAQASATDAMENLLCLRRVSLEDLVELRVLLEGSAVERAATGGDQDHIQTARAALDRMKLTAIDDIATFRRADLEFHRSLCLASGNHGLALLMDVLRATILTHLGEALERHPEPANTMQRIIEEHAELLCAVERGHSRRARAIVTDHIRRFYTPKEPHDASMDL